MGLREIRESAGLRQSDVAKVLGMSTAQYSRYESGKSKLLIAQARSIAEVLGCRIEDIVSTKEEGASNVIVPRFASTRRTIPVFSLAREFDVRSATAEKIDDYSPTSSVSIEAYAVQASDDALANNGRTSIFMGDWCVIDPSVQPNPGDVVLAIDQATGRRVLRIYRPLHPSNPRAPGYILAATAPGIDEIYVSGHDGIEGVVVEKRSLMR